MHHNVADPRYDENLRQDTNFYGANATDHNVEADILKRI